MQNLSFLYYFVKVQVNSPGLWGHPEILLRTDVIRSLQSLDFRVGLLGLQPVLHHLGCEFGALKILNQVFMKHFGPFLDLRD